MNKRFFWTLCVFLSSLLEGKVVDINSTLSFVEIEHDGIRVKIERVLEKGLSSHSLSELQPMQIGEVKTLGELEVLTFIQKSKKDARLMLIDSRTKRWYHKETIASAINLPFSMLEEKSAYQKKIITLLGGIYRNQQWDFSDVNTLLIFGNSLFDIQATSAIKSLIKLGYPQEKLLYFRGGIESWKRLNLSVIH